MPMALPGSAFVLWNGRSFGEGRAQFASLKAANDFINAPVAREYTELVEALTRMYGRVGMHEICRMCFAGKKLPALSQGEYYRVEGHWGNHGNGPGVGCCKPCGLQGHKGCLSKPLGCATWMCGYTADRFRSTYNFVCSVRVLIAAALGYRYGFFDDVRPQALDPEQSRLLRVARWAVDSWAV